MRFDSIPLEIQRQRNAQIEAEILAVLAESPGIHGRQIWIKCEKKATRRTVDRAVGRLFYREAITRKGSGLKGNYYRYFVNKSNDVRTF